MANGAVFTLYAPCEPTTTTTATTTTARSQRTRSCCSRYRSLAARSYTLCIAVSLFLAHAHALIPTVSPSVAVQSDTQFLAAADRRAAAAAAVIESSSAVLQLQLAALASDLPDYLCKLDSAVQVAHLHWL